MKESHAFNVQAALARPPMRELLAHLSRWVPEVSASSVGDVISALISENASETLLKIIDLQRRIHKQNSQLLK